MSKGSRLESKGELKEAAEWFQQHGQYLDAARCWEKHGYRSDIGNAVSCYMSAGLPKKAAECLERFGRVSEAIKMYEELGDYQNASRCWLHLVNQTEYKTSMFLTAFYYAANHLSVENAQEVIRSNWASFADTIKQTRGSGLIGYEYYKSEDAGELAHILRTFEGQPFLNEMVITLAHGFFFLSEDSKNVSPIYFAMLLRERCRLPLAAATVCNKALERKVRAWEGDLHSEEENEEEWLRELSGAYIDAGESEKALDVYISRNRYAEAAAVLEEVGRLEEALVLLQQTGPENYRLREGNEPWKGCVPPDYYRRQYWEAKIGQLKGKIAARKCLASKEEKGERTAKLTISEIESMFALGEIAKEEFERMKKDLE